MARGLKSAGAALKSFGNSAKRIGALFAKTFLAAGAAIVGFAAKALSAYAKQEAAERSMASAFRAYGEEVENNTEKVKAFASAIQDETGVADEQTIATAAQLKMLGVATDQLEAATKATIALKSAGMAEATATRAVAAARAGDYSMLTRYIPELRTATDEAEKARIVNEFLTRGYAQQKEQLNTVAGQWGLLKGRVSDVWEEVGRAIAQNGVLIGVLSKASDRVKAFGKAVVDWAEKGGFSRIASQAVLFYEEVRHRFQMLGNDVRVVFSAIADRGEGALKYLQGVIHVMVYNWARQFAHMGETAKLTWDLIRNPSREAFAALRKHAKEAAIETVENIAAIGKAFTSGEIWQTKRTEDALNERQRIRDEYNERMIEANKKSLALLANDTVDEAEDTAQEIISIADEQAAEERKRRERELAEAKKAAKEKVKIERDRINNEIELSRKKERTLLQQAERMRKMALATGSERLAMRDEDREAARQEQRFQRLIARAQQAEADPSRRASRRAEDALKALRAEQAAAAEPEKQKALQQEMADLQRKSEEHLAHIAKASEEMVDKLSRDD